MALWYRLPFDGALRTGGAAAFAGLGLATLWAVIRGRALRGMATFCLALAAVIWWWGTLTPPAEANWSPDVARQVTGEIKGDQLTLTDVRNFDWRTPQDFTPRWETRSYDLSQVQTVDLFMSYWGRARDGAYDCQLRLCRWGADRLVGRGAQAGGRRVLSHCGSVQDQYAGAGCRR